MADRHQSTMTEAQVPKATESDWIVLNVGGVKHSTTRLTLISREPDSMLARMFSPDQILSSRRDKCGAYLIDRNGQYFGVILDYLRRGVLLPGKNISLVGLAEEAQFFGLTHLQELVAQQQVLETELSRRDVLRVLASSPANSELRFQGINLTGMDLSNLDLRNINFKYACLAGCNLSYADLSGCSLEQANLKKAILDGGRLFAVNARSADMEGCSLKNCDFAAPTGKKCIFEGTNLKDANFEGSMMEGLNLRVANLKNANIKVCTLNYADMSGANMEGCDFSGSSLTNTNMRGANLINARLDNVITPLHMSQTM